MLAGMLAFSGPATASLITNGSFETGTNPPTVSFTTLGNGSTAIDGWIVNGTVDWIFDYWVPSDGSRSIDLNGRSLGGLSTSTTFATVIGNTYELTFDMAGNPDRPALTTMDVTVGGITQSFSFDTTGKTLANMGWETNSLSFIASSAMTSLSFASTTTVNGCCYGPALDNVAVESIPEPSTISMFAFALAAFGFVNLRRRGNLTR